MNTNTSNHDGSTEIQVTAGEQNKNWKVVPIDTDGEKAEFEVHYPDKNKHQDVVISKDGLFNHCSGTYFEHNSTCPHVEACEHVLRKIEEHSTGSTTQIDDPVYCELCGQVHRGSCDSQTTHKIW